MATAAAPGITSYVFDDRHICCYTLGDFKHFVFAMLDVDVPGKIVDFVLKFPANEKIFLHRQLALTNTLVVPGDHILYEPNGQVTEVRRVGSYTSDASTRQVIAFHVGDRSSQSATALCEKLPAAYREQAIFYTDK
jgi:hypothetical protein